MKRTIGASTIACLIAVAGLTSVGVAGFTGMTPSVCSMLSLGCDGAKGSKVVEASAKEPGQCSKAAGACSKTEQVAAKDAAECANACPFETLKVTQAAFDEAVASGCEKSKAEAHVKLIQAKLAAAQTELAQAEAKIVAIHAEAKEAGLCEQACFGAKTEQVAAKAAAECDKAAGTCSKTEQVAAKDAAECAKAAGTCSKTEQVAAKDAAECANACPFETLKVTQAAFDEAVASGCEKSKAEAHVKLIQAKLAVANTELAKAEEVGCATSKAEAQAKIAAIHAEAKDAGLCEKACFGEAAVQNAAASEAPAQCTKSKAEKTQASAPGRETPAVVGASSPFVIPAAFAPKASGGCCKAKTEQAKADTTETVVTR